MLVSDKKRREWVVGVGVGEEPGAWGGGHVLPLVETPKLACPLAASQIGVSDGDRCGREA